MTTTTTTNGKFEILEGYDAGKLMSDNLRIYMAKMSSGSEATRSSTEDKLGQLGTGAGVVGALCGVAGLAGGKESTTRKIEMSIDNISSYPLIPCRTNMVGCDLELAPRPMLSSDNTSLRIEIVDRNTLLIETDFYIGVTSGINIELKMQIVHDKTTETDMWQIVEATIDGTKAATGWPRYGSAQTLKFEATQSGYPSFCFHYFPVDLEGVASLLFCDNYA